MLPSVLFSLQLIKFNQKCTHTSTKGTKGLKREIFCKEEERVKRSTQPR